MTKAELIEKLKDVPDNAEILIFKQDQGSVYDILEIDYIKKIETVYLEICNDY